MYERYFREMNMRQKLAKARMDTSHIRPHMATSLYLLGKIFPKKQKIHSTLEENLATKHWILFENPILRT